MVLSEIDRQDRKHRWALHVDLHLHQQGIDTTTPAGKTVFQMMGVFAEFERSMNQERVRAGLARARSKGKRLGRPTIPQEKEDAIRAALSQPGRPGVRVIAKQFGVDPSTVQRSAALSTRPQAPWCEGQWVARPPVGSYAAISVKTSAR